MAAVNYTNANGVIYALTSTTGLFGAPEYNLVITYPTGGGNSVTVNGIPAANVLTANGTINAAAGVGGTYVIPPTVTGSVNILAAVGTNTIYVGGTATLDTAVSLLGNVTVYDDGGSVTLTSGLAAGALGSTTINLDNHGTFSNGTSLLSALNGTTINFGQNGGTFIANAGGTTLNLSQMKINGFTAAQDKIEFENLTGAVSSYSISTSGTSQTIALYGSGGVSLGSVVVAGTSLPTGTVTQGHSGPLTVSQSGTTVTIDPGTSILTCFLIGTRICTPDGDVNVESLRSGDLVLTPDGRAIPVRWVGVTTVSTAFVDPARVMPIRIQASALAENVPSRDLYVSPDHSMYLDGALIPAQLLVNGMTITQCSRSGNIAYYHVEVDPHDIILAEGAATESYLDTGNRSSFNQNGIRHLVQMDEPKSWEDACAPLLLAGPKLDAIQARLIARAETLISDIPSAAAA